MLNIVIVCIFKINKLLCIGKHFISSVLKIVFEKEAGRSRNCIGRKEAVSERYWERGKNIIKIHCMKNNVN